MKAIITTVESGTITTPQGFLAGAVNAGLKSQGADILDLGLLYSEVPASAAGVFTLNCIKGAPLLVTQSRLPYWEFRALVVNSGCANTSVGEAGLNDALAMTELTARKLGVAVESCLVASTGVIGRRLPMDLIEDGVGLVEVSEKGGHELARAIMTTDTVPKETAVEVRVEDSRFSIGGIAKGSGMIHPDMATLLGFLTTDAQVTPSYLKKVLREVVAETFNMVTVDGDTSPNDMVLAMANGMAGNQPITGESELAEGFREALLRVCTQLARGIARDGEGATKLIEVSVNGAVCLEDARLAARTIAASALVKTAVHGNDPNWGRIIAALGRSGAEVIEGKTDLYLGDICLVKGGKPLPFTEETVVRLIDRDEVAVRLELNLGDDRAVAWGCDLSEEYVTINSEYTT